MTVYLLWREHKSKTLPVSFRGVFKTAEAAKKSVSAVDWEDRYGTLIANDGEWRFTITDSAVRE